MFQDVRNIEDNSNDNDGGIISQHCRVLVNVLCTHKDLLLQLKGISTLKFLSFSVQNQSICFPN